MGTTATPVWTYNFTTMKDRDFFPMFVWNHNAISYGVWLMVDETLHPSQFRYIIMSWQLLINSEQVITAMISW